MTDFTPEQEAEIQKRIADAKVLEQYRISGDMFFREGLAAVSAKVQQGIISPFVLEVGKDQYARYLVTFFPQGAPAPEKKDEGADDEKPEE